VELGRALQRPLLNSRVSGRFVDHSGTVARGLPPRGELLRRLLTLGPLSPRCFLDLYVLLHLDEDVPHLGDIVLHQMLVQ